MRIKCLRIFPETIPRITWLELSNFNLNIALGNAIVTVASTSIGSDLATVVSKTAWCMLADGSAVRQGDMLWDKWSADKANGRKGGEHCVVGWEGGVAVERPGVLKGARDLPLLWFGG